MCGWVGQYLILNLGMSPSFQAQDFQHLQFPSQMFVDYVRVYQRDGVDGGPAGFIADLNATKQMLKPFGIPISMSEDWDRPGKLANADRTALGPLGLEIAPLMDNLQLRRA